MKKRYSLLVTIMITFLLVVVFTWFMPGGTYYSGSFAKGEIVPLGLVDLFKIPLWTAGTIFQFSLIFLVIGGFYGVLNKTGVYSKLVEGIVKKYKKKSNVFLIITVLTLGIVSSIMGGNIYLFLVVPFLATVLLKLGYGKCATLLATVGSLFVGVMGSTFAFDISGYINYYLSLDLANGIIYKIVVLVLSLALLLVFLIKFAKKEDKVEEILLYEEVKKDKNSKSVVPLVVIVLLGLVICLIGTFSWTDMYGATFFTDMYNSIMKISIGDYAIVKNILGSMVAIGNWSSQDVNILIIIMTLTIGWIYSIKFQDILDSFVKGAKEMLPTFAYATLANVLLAILMNSSSGEFINYTMMNFFFNLGDGFNAIAHGLAVAVDSLFISYFPYLSSDILQSATSVYTSVDTYPVIGLVTQTVYGFVMYVLPTSILLIAGLSFFKVSYKEWLQYVWKYLLGLLGIMIVVITIAALVI